MRSALVLAMAAYGAGILETVAGPRWAVGNVSPDLLGLVAWLWLVGRRGPGDFLAVGAVGLWGDCLSGHRLGLGLAAYLLVGWLAMRYRRAAVPWGACGSLALVAGATAGSNLLLVLATLSPRGEGLALGHLVRDSLAVALYTTAWAGIALLVRGSTRLREPWHVAS